MVVKRWALAFDALKRLNFTLTETDVIATAHSGDRAEDLGEPLLSSHSEQVDDEFHFEDRLDQVRCPQRPALKSLNFLSCREPLKQALGLSLQLLHEAAERVRVSEKVEILMTLSKPITGWTAASETALHLAARRGQVHTVRFLTLTLSPEDKNAHGDILDVPSEFGNADAEIEKILQGAGAMRGRDMIVQESNMGNLETYTEPKRLCQQPFHDGKCGSLKSTTDLMLIAMTLIATMSLKLAIRPPSGFGLDYESSNGSFQDETQDPLLNQLFFLFNSVAFFTSTALITILLQDFPFKPWLQILIFSTIGSYICGVKMNSPHEVPMVLFVGTSISLTIFLIYVALHKMILDYLQSVCCRLHETEKPWSLKGASSSSSLPSPINNV